MPIDRHGRSLGTLRLSVTDRCNLRCTYCMPEDDYVWLDSAAILSVDEIVSMARAFVSLGVREVRLTGGEPLLRPELETIIARLSQLGVDLALTTNGVLFAPRARALRAAGLSRVTLSLDTLRPERALKLSKTTRLADVLASLDAARDAGFTGTKLNTVVMRGHNDDELAEIVAFAREKDAEPRFIEYMDVGGATRWKMGEVFSAGEIVRAIGGAFRGASPAEQPRGASPAQRFETGDGTTFGVIASTTEPFCGTCDRARITADGMMFTCLYAECGLDLRGPLRAGCSEDELARILSDAWSLRADRGAEERLVTPARGALVPVTRLRADPHREMHTRGG